MEKGHLAWDSFVVHDVNNPLVLLCDYHITMLECGYSMLLCYLPLLLCAYHITDVFDFPKNSNITHLTSRVTIV